MITHDPAPELRVALAVAFQSCILYSREPDHKPFLGFWCL